VALASLGRSALEAWEVPRDLLLRRYPAFVTGGGLEPGEIPVFTFHGAEPESFGRALLHLSRNGYRTLGIDEYVAVLRGRVQAPPRAVLLTFDDGRGSVWSVAAPLLRRHGMRAACFLVPGRVPSHPPGPTLDDVEAGRADRGAVLARERAFSALLSWQEIEALERSGTFAFHSHTLSHARVHTGPELAGFVTPQSRLGYDAFDQPLVRAGDRDLLGTDVPLGTPVFRSAPRTSDARRFFEDEAVRGRCVALVADAGGERFFERADWRSRLAGAFAGTRVEGRVETADEQEAHLRRELVEARRLIEQHTGRPAVHLCYPWHVSGALARRLASEAGYESAFCGKVEGVPITRPGGDLQRIARLGEDWLELLPGEGRASLTQVLRRKWGRRFLGARG
jgi:peptidoglycan/xylan/chitin deacetylase (PgdA/CDA1 family)